MSTFYYRARDKTGKLISGEVEAVSGDELKESLFREEMIPIVVREVKASAFSFDKLVNFFRRVKHEDLMIFTRQFYTLFKAGVSMDTILGSLTKQVKNPLLSNALTRIRSDVAAGATLSQAFGRHPKIFNGLYVAMLTAGEEAGILEGVLRQLTTLLERDFEIQKGVKNAMLYPKIVISVLVLAIVFLMSYVVPKFSSFYGHYGAKLPLPTMILITSSNFVRK
jgi:type II secretory pathway component PulF